MMVRDTLGHQLRIPTFTRARANADNAGMCPNVSRPVDKKVAGVELAPSREGFA